MRNVLWGVLLTSPHINMPCHGKFSQTWAIAAVWALIHAVALHIFLEFLCISHLLCLTVPATGLCILRPAFKLLHNLVNMWKGVSTGALSSQRDEK